ncbi:MAG TPA: hypothetical protein VGQ99_24065 [Tepidisphaeraceae bacterium]|jgi:hypothetical protein|nr:hypothetical protein [Tepidisphaeraceae bacterium]
MSFSFIGGADIPVRHPFVLSAILIFCPHPQITPLYNSPRVAQTVTFSPAPRNAISKNHWKISEKNSIFVSKRNNNAQLAFGSPLATTTIASAALS